MGGGRSHSVAREGDTVGTRKTVRLALLVAMGLALFLFESTIPRPVPWLRLGLANVATLMALSLFGLREAFVVAVLRAVLGSMIVGGLLNPSFVFSLLGGLVSATMMALVVRFSGGVFSVVGVSVWGALAHNLSQLALAIIVFVRRWELLSLVPLFLLSSVGTGFFTGVVVFLLLERLSST